MVAAGATLIVSGAALPLVVCGVPCGTRYIDSTWNVYRFHLEPTYNMLQEEGTRKGGSQVLPLQRSREVPPQGHSGEKMQPKPKVQGVAARMGLQGNGAEVLYSP